MVGSVAGGKSRITVTTDAAKKPDFIQLDWFVDYQKKKVNFTSCRLTGDESGLKPDQCKKKAAENGIK